MNTEDSPTKECGLDDENAGDIQYDRPLVGLADGWEYDYQPETRFIQGSHPKGGKRSVAELSRGMPDNLGHYFADCLNRYRSIND